MSEDQAADRPTIQRDPYWGRYDRCQDLLRRAGIDHDVTMSGADLAGLMRDQDRFTAVVNLVYLILETEKRRKAEMEAVGKELGGYFDVVLGRVHEILRLHPSFNDWAGGGNGMPHD